MVSKISVMYMAHIQRRMANKYSTPLIKKDCIIQRSYKDCIPDSFEDDSFQSQKIIKW